jgi:transcription antitermination protein NusB
MSYGDLKDEAPQNVPDAPPIHFKRMGRELAMQYLFQCDVNGEPAKQETMTIFWEQAESSGAFPENRHFRKAKAYAEKLIVGVTNDLPKIDGTIAEFSEKWELERMAVVDRNILRVAIFELTSCPDIPPLVSIDEAIEISKEFGAEKSGMFINGILNGVKDSVKKAAAGKA